MHGKEKERNEEKEREGGGGKRRSWGGNMYENSDDYNRRSYVKNYRARKIFKFHLRSFIFQLG